MGLIATSTITHTERDASGNFVNYVANFRLTTAAGQDSGFKLSDGSGISAITKTSSVNGTIGLALENNANITPGGSFYVAELLLPSSNGGTQEAAIISSSSVNPQSLYGALISAIPNYVPPTTVPPTVLSGNNIFTGTNQFNGKVLFEGGPQFYVGPATNSTADIDNINAAVAKAAAGPGQRGVVVFDPTMGTPYKVSPLGISLTSQPVTLQGANDRGTIIKSTGGNHIFYSTDSSAITGLCIRDLALNFSTAQNTWDCVNIQNAQLYRIENNSFSNGNNGVNLTLNDSLGHISGNVFGSGNNVGVLFGAGSNQNRFVGNWIDENLNLGVDCNASGNVLVGNPFQDNTNTHLRLNTAATENVVVANTFKHGATPNTQAVLDTYGQNDIFAFNTISALGANDVIVRSTATNERITGNTFDSPASIVDSGAGTFITDNIGYNPAGTISTVAINSTAFTYTAGSRPEVGYLSGGGISSIQRLTVTVSTSLPFTVALAPHDQVIINSSTTPPIFTIDRK